jgi:hypothetical protein
MPFPLGGLIEELQSLLYHTLLLSELILSRGNHADRIPGKPGWLRIESNDPRSTLRPAPQELVEQPRSLARTRSAPHVGGRGRQPLFHRLVRKNQA